jgi:predicted nucleic acid-binding protein
VKFLLDTNVLSEPSRPRADPRVIAWLDALGEDDAAASVLSIGEIRHGVLSVESMARKARLEAWADKLSLSLGDQILPVDLAVVEAWARIRLVAPRTLKCVDSLIAATALAHGLKLATRNERDFIGTDVQIVNPWTA